MLSISCRNIIFKEPFQRNKHMGTLGNLSYLHQKYTMFRNTLKMNCIQQPTKVPDNLFMYSVSKVTFTYDLHSFFLFTVCVKRIYRDINPVWLFLTKNGGIFKTISILTDAEYTLQIKRVKVPIFPLKRHFISPKTIFKKSISQETVT